MIGSTIRSTRGSVADDLRKIDGRISELTDELRAALEERATLEAIGRLCRVIDVDTTSTFPAVTDPAVQPLPKTGTNG